MDPRLVRAQPKQPDQRSCGAATLVVARSIADPAYADRLADGVPGATGTVQDRFAVEVLATHRRTTRAVSASGTAQVPWPRHFGTPPWAVAHELEAITGIGWRTLAVTPWDRRDALSAVRAAARLRPVPLYVGSRWLPRHVVLVLDEDLRTYEPSSGRVVTFAAERFTKARLDLAGWSSPWFAVLPR
jgi:hypothetical protein